MDEPRRRWLVTFRNLEGDLTHASVHEADSASDALIQAREAGARISDCRTLRVQEIRNGAG